MNIVNSWMKWPILCIVIFVFLNIYASYAKIELEDGYPLGYGAYGLVLGNYTPSEQEKNVLFLGNSVHAGYGIVEWIQRRFIEAKIPVRFGNFAHGGASVADYITHYRHVRQFKPDLLVVAINPSSLGQAWPFFRNDSYKKILHPNYISLLKYKTIRDLYSKEMYAESFWYSYFPVFRWIEVAKIYTNRHLGQKTRDSKITSLRIWNFFRIRASLAFDIIMRREEGKKANEVVPVIEDNEYINAEELMKVLISELDKDNQKTLFIIQPNSMPKGPVVKKLGQLVEGNPNFYFADHAKFWAREKYSDDVHPSTVGAEEDTFRQFQLINQILNDK